MDQHNRHSGYDLSHVPPSQLQLHHIQHARQTSNPSIPVQQQQQQPQDPALTQSRMEESLKRSVTLVFWYKAGCDPLRLHQEITTFPYFKLAQFTQLVNDLGLSQNTNVDAFNPVSSTWEQQFINTVRQVESEQRLLYRIRKSLLEGLSDNDCPGVDHEIGLQPRPARSPGAQVVPSSTINPLKRPADPADSYVPPSKYYRHDEYNGSRAYDASPSSQESTIYPQSISVPKSQPQNDVPSYSQQSSPPIQNAHPSTIPSHAPSNHNNGHQYPTPSPGLSTPSTSQSSTSGEPAIPYHPHPPLKRWPNDYTVSEIALGFRRMDAMISSQPTLTQKSTFQKVFGCRYIKSTVCRHRAVWKRADPNLKEGFERMGSDERAVWGEFVKKAEGKVTANGHMNGNGHGSHPSQGVDTSQTNGPPPGPSHLPPPSAQMLSGMQGGVPPPTSVTMGMLTHGLPPHVGLGPDPDKNEGPPVMASLVPPPSHVAGGNMHSGHVSANNHEPPSYLPQSSTSNSQNS
ncbi:hypothetical protein QCA50_001128 [Cerrena zonata]|uniref:Uncharacterized protein n=1 Tax=Cerrena zonata TaxID=2478898 RepID=A0AAW0GSF6_9APHY